MNYQPYLAAVAALGVVSCTPDAPLNATPEQAVSPVTHSAPAPRYVALPGQAPVAVSTDVDAAFEQQAAAYAGQPVAPATPTVAAQPVAPTAGSIPATPLVPATPAATTAATAAQPAVAIPLPGSTPEAGALTQTTDAAQPTAPATAPVAGLPTDPSALTPAAPAPVQEHENPAATGTMNYKIRITNGTEGRLFVEAQDAGGAIYPCGFMEGGRTFTTPMENSAPIKGPITVVVRDPDQPDAPEIRRYKVDPPTADYNGKAIGISILSGGRYVASLDGQTYAASPAAVPTPQPAPEAAAPAPESPAPAPEAAAPAPEPAPAGV
ncbi:MAG: hypothetical protein ACI4OS_01470 [Akkermansia sp.]